MPTVTITQPAGPEAVQPKATIITDNGSTLALPYAPRTTKLGGRGAKWSQQDRPGRKPLNLRDGDGLPTMTVDVQLARPDHQDSVEDLIAALTVIAESGQRVTLLNLSPYERGPWRIDDLSIAGEMRQAGTNAITRATATLSLVGVSDAVPNLGPVSGGTRQPSKLGKKGGTYTVKKGDTLRSIAGDVYGDVGEWKRIADANKIDKPGEKLKTGRKLKITALDKTPGKGKPKK